MDRPGFTSVFARPKGPARHNFSLKRWSRGKRDVSTWDGIRRDVDLFEEDADCSVFLYAQGQSQRGPAFRLPSHKLSESKCMPLLDTAQRKKTSGRYYSQAANLELYLPAPPGLLRQDAIKCHIATRNFFAWLCGRPLVGHFLGDALADLFDCMHMWREPSADNVEDLLIYADHMGYTIVEHHSDHALAMLNFAEKVRLRHVWIDSFAHCTGMSSELSRSSEYEPISHATKQLINKAHSEMDAHLDRTSRALVGFLEQELSAAYLGLSDGARKHLDAFRSFLHALYVGRFGYWPPYSPTNFPKDLYYDLYDDFSCLYNLMADKDSPSHQGDIKAVTGGICVQQNVEAFNSRHKFNPLPYTLPLVPQLHADDRSRSQSNLRVFGRRRESSVPPGNKLERARFALRAATNCDSEVVTQSGLVQQYLLWEEEHAARPSEKVSVADARKVQWLLIYGLLQTLVAAIQAPPEVRDSTTADYPLCILTEDLPLWNDTSVPRQTMMHHAHAAVEGDSASSVSTSESRENDPPSPTFSIRPDCEVQTYFDYWIGNNSSSESQVTPIRPPLLKRSTTKLRKASGKRRSSQTSQARSVSQPELVSGRTLAELVYGEQPKQQDDESAIVTGFDFGFDQGSDQSQRSSTDRQLVTFDGLHDSLPGYAVTSQAGESDDRSSVPSLTFSQRSSQGTVDSFPYDRSSAVEAYDSWSQGDLDAMTKEVGADGQAGDGGSLPLEGLREKLQEAADEQQSYPCIVTGFTDLFAKIGIPSSDSDDSSIDESMDRAAVIENDGAFTLPQIAVGHRWFSRGCEA